MATGGVTTGFGSATSVGRTSAYGTGVGVTAPIMQKAGSGIAIFVEAE